MDALFDIKESWQKNRKRYNIALIIAGFFGFLSYCIVGASLIPYFETTIFTIIPQGLMYLIMMLFANIGYTFLMHIDSLFNHSNQNTLSHKIIYYGYWGISCFLPFSISILLYILHHDGYSNVVN